MGGADDLPSVEHNSNAGLNSSPSSDYYTGSDSHVSSDSNHDHGFNVVELLEALPLALSKGTGTPGWSASYVDPFAVSDNQAVRKQLATDYENIFSIWPFARKSDRTICVHPEDRAYVEFGFIWNGWFSRCFDNPSRADDHLFMPDGRVLGVFISSFIPDRLDLNRWTMPYLRSFLTQRITQETGVHVLAVELQPYHSGEKIIQEPSTDLQTVPFVGPPEEGRLIWQPMHGCRVHRRNPTEYNRIIIMLRSAERGLIALARRIAYWVAMAIVWKHAIPVFERSHGQRVVSRRMLDCAVREILGREWFDLPFDKDNELRNWSIDYVIRTEAQIKDLRQGCVDAGRE